MKIHIENNYASFTCQTFGAELLSYRDSRGREYLWQKDPIYWAKTSPVLFPFIGPECKNILISGERYDMPRHGIVRDLEFQILKKGENSVTFYVESNAETKKVYPFDFVFTVSFALRRDILEIIYGVENKTDSDMPFLLGGHPGFFCPMVEGEKFTDYRLIFADGDKEDVVLDYPMFDNDAIFFENFKEHTVKLVSSKTGTGIECQFPDYQSIAFWTPIKKEAPFLCIEPWNGGTMQQLEEKDILKKKYVQILEAGKKKEYHFRFRPI